MLFLYKHPFKSLDLKEKKYDRTMAGAAQSLPGLFGHLPIKVTGAAPSPQHSSQPSKCNRIPQEACENGPHRRSGECQAPKPRCWSLQRSICNDATWRETGENKKKKQG